MTDTQKPEALALRLADAYDEIDYETATELRRLHAENEALRADAERYRWLRAVLADRSGKGKSHWICCIPEGCSEDLDIAIDAAMKEKP